jgi:acetolactate synthase-1/3 small subunit
VKNHVGVLTRIAGLFSRRGYNIESFTAGATENKDVTYITIQLMGDEEILEQIKNQLKKIVDVIKVTELKPGQSIQIESAFVKVKSNDNNRSNIMEIAQVFRANIIAMTHDHMILELTTDGEKINAFIELMEPYGVIEFIRSGTIGLQGDDKVLL